MAAGPPVDSPIDIDRLDAYLLSDNAPDNSVGVSEIDGFLTALVIGPALVMPSEWLPVIWGHERPKFTDAEETQAIIGTIMGRYNEIISNLNADPTTVDPIFEQEPNGRLHTADWCAGFLDGVKLRPAAWASLLTGKAGSPSIEPILTLGGESGDYKLFGLRRKASADRERRTLMDKAPDLIVDRIFAIWEHWQEQRRGSQAVRAPVGIAIASPAAKPKPARTIQTGARKTTGAGSVTPVEATTHVIRASLKARLYRDIEIDSSASLYDLAQAVIQSYDFDPEHAFGFFSKLTGNVYGSPVSYELFSDTEGGSRSRSVERTAINAAYRRLGAKLLFLFDYGDEWKFTTEFVALGRHDPQIDYPRVVGMAGKAPVQYPDAEDDE